MELEVSFPSPRVRAAEYSFMKVNSAAPATSGSHDLRRVEFWPGMSADLDLASVARAAVGVKGVAFRDPLRFLEIYENTISTRQRYTSGKRMTRFDNLTHLGSNELNRLSLPRIPGVTVQLGARVLQPPFAWREAEPHYLAISFTYNTNAFFRILSMLHEEGHIGTEHIEQLLDCACLRLAELYRAQSHFLIRHINNNFNMWLISKVIESLVGRRCYDADQQEPQQTRRSLATAITLAASHKHLPLHEKMGVALGKGATFIEARFADRARRATAARDAQSEAHCFFGRSLVIDHRTHLVQSIENTGLRFGRCVLAVVLDDVAESVDDLLWLQDLLNEFSFLTVRLLTNTAQISINFSAQMLASVLRAPVFNELRAHYGGRFRVTRLYCPFISFQSNYLPPVARRAIAAADIVFVKGANFFETCQLPEKETFHAFVVCGSVSQRYTGCPVGSGVFAHVPAGVAGYRHARRPERVQTLWMTVDRATASSQPAR